MKKGILVLCALLLIVVSAGNASAITVLKPAPIFEFDPSLILILDPCLFASFRADVFSAGSLITVASGVDYFVGVYRYELDKNGTTVGHLITKYTRVSVGSTDMVSTEDTAFIDSLGLAVFGHGANDVIGLVGAHGVIDSAITMTGARRAINGTYTFSNFTGQLEFCAFKTD